MCTLTVRRLTTMGILPRFNGRGYDLFAAIQRPMKIHPSSTATIPLGISVKFPDGMYGRPAMHPHIPVTRIVDLSLCESINVINGQFMLEIQPGEKIAEFTIENVVKMEIKHINSN